VENISLTVQTVGEERLRLAIMTAACHNRRKVQKANIEDLFSMVQLPSRDKGTLVFEFRPTPLLLALAQCPN
jgi:hypothetical protein